MFAWRSCSGNQERLDWCTFFLEFERLAKIEFFLIDWDGRECENRNAFLQRLFETHPDEYFGQEFKNP